MVRDITLLQAARMLWLGHQVAMQLSSFVLIQPNSAEDEAVIAPRHPRKLVESALDEGLFHGRKPLYQTSTCQETLATAAPLKEC